MKDGYIQKIVGIGEKEECSHDDLSYFLDDLPWIANKDLLHKLHNEYGISIDHITRREFLCLDTSKPTSSNKDLRTVTFIENIIKGCHLIEVAYGGFGSTTIIYNLFWSLISTDVKRAMALYDWIAFRGGNYYIEENILFDKASTRERKINESEREYARQQKMISDNLTKQRQDKLTTHLSKSKSHNDFRKLELSKLREMSPIEILRHAITSSYPIDMYPREMIIVDLHLLSELTLKERLNFQAKLSMVQRKSPWKKLAKRLLPILKMISNDQYDGN